MLNRPRMGGGTGPTKLLVSRTPCAGCYSLLGLAAASPKQRPPVGSGDVRQFRDFGPWLVGGGRRHLCAGLGLGGVLIFMYGGATRTHWEMGVGPLVKGCALTRGIELVWGYAPSRSPRWTTPGGSATQRRYLLNES